MDSVDVEGKRIAVDDPRLDPVWAKCGELGIPVLIHTAGTRDCMRPEICSGADHDRSRPAASGTDLSG